MSRFLSAFARKLDSEIIRETARDLAALAALAALSLFVFAVWVVASGYAQSVLLEAAL